MKCKLIFVFFFFVLLGSHCRRPAPPPEQKSANSEQIAPTSVIAGQPGSDKQVSNIGYQTLVCQAVLEKIYQASGGAAHPLPAVFLSEGTTCMAAFFSRKNAIEVERRTYEVCRSFGSDSLSALAFVLGHELSHALDVEGTGGAFHSNFWAYSRQAGSSVEREKSADVRGAFMAHLAGYRIVAIVPALIQKLYAAYPAQGQSTAYPSEKERRRTAVEVQGLVDTLIQVFDIANDLLAAGQGDLASVCYDHVLQVYKSAEIWNNFGIACALEALRLPGNDDFAYPLELDWQLRLSRPRGATPTGQQLRQRQALLSQAQSAFAEAVRLAPNRFAVQINAWCIAAISGEATRLQLEMDRFSATKKLSRPESERLSLIRALAAAQAGDQAKAEQLLTQLSTAAVSETAALASYNLNVLKQGSNQAILQYSPLPCPIDPTAIELPSMLTLRRMAVAFEGLPLGKNGELTLTWEKNAGQRLLKARLGTNRFCILHLVSTQRTLRPPVLTTYPGFHGPSNSRFIACEDHYLQLFQSGKMSHCGVYYAYRNEE